jgi:hypothetical protein
VLLIASYKCNSTKLLNICVVALGNRIRTDFHFDMPPKKGKKGKKGKGKGKGKKGKEDAGPDGADVGKQAAAHEPTQKEVLLEQE